MKKIFFLIVFSAFFAACSTQKNTSTTRAYHNLTAHYNVYFNGLMSYLNGLEKIDKAKDNYASVLPVFKYDDDNAAKLAISDMDITLKKMGKTITLHSITAKPKIKNIKDLTPQQKEFLEKNEYCKWIDDAYLLIGMANYIKRDYHKALRAFRRILNVYKGENSIPEAKLWIAKVYTRQKKYTDATQTLLSIDTVNTSKKFLRDYYLSKADLLINEKKYKTAIYNLNKGLKLTNDKAKKARYYFILAQLYNLTGNTELARKYYKKVIKINQGYELTFNAKLQLATVVDKSGAEQIKKKLKKMLKDEKNVDYKDRIYYALATIYLNEKDTANALKNLKLSAQFSQNNQIQKVNTYLKIADIYFRKKDYVQSGFYYDSTMQFLQKNHPDYNLISSRAKITGDLVSNFKELRKQDSLQRIAKMPEKERMKIINKLIQEEIQREQQAKQALTAQNNSYDPTDFSGQNPVQNNSGKWYMYNQVLISRGHNEFIKKWGQRKLEDNWRRKNKAVISDFSDDLDNKEKENKKDKKQDKKSPEYYLKNLPLNDSLMAISNKKVEQALFNIAYIYEHKLHNSKLAIKYYKLTLQRFPQTDYKLEIYYSLYKLYKNNGDNIDSDKYKSLIIRDFPESKYAKMLKDPLYVEKMIQNKEKAEQTYEKIVDLYDNMNYSKAFILSDKALRQFSESDLFPYFKLIKAKCFGNMNQRDSMFVYLKDIAKNYPKIQAGKIANDILVMSKQARYNYDIYSFNPDTVYYYAIVLPKKSDNGNFRFQLKKFAEQFSLEHKFKIKTQKLNANQDVITVSYFNNLEEALKFSSYIENKNLFNSVKDNFYAFPITPLNLAIFLKDRSIDKYFYFLKKNNIVK